MLPRLGPTPLKKASDRAARRRGLVVPRNTSKPAKNHTNRGAHGLGELVLVIDIIARGLDGGPGFPRCGGPGNPSEKREGCSSVQVVRGLRHPVTPTRPTLTAELHSGSGTTHSIPTLRTRPGVFSIQDRVCRTGLAYIFPVSGIGEHGRDEYSLGVKDRLRRRLPALETAARHRRLGCCG